MKRSNCYQATLHIYLISCVYSLLVCYAHDFPCMCYAMSIYNYIYNYIYVLHCLLYQASMTYSVRAELISCNQLIFCIIMKVMAVLSTVDLSLCVFIYTYTRFTKLMCLLECAHNYKMTPDGEELRHLFTQLTVFQDQMYSTYILVV